MRMNGRQGLSRFASLLQVAGLTILLSVLLPWETRSQPMPQAPRSGPPTGAEPPLAEPAVSPASVGPTTPPSPPVTPIPAVPADTPLPQFQAPQGPSPLDPPISQVVLRVRVPAETEPGKDLEYHLTVQNVSQAEAHHVIVRDRLPAKAKLVKAEPQQTRTDRDSQDLLWDFGTLRPNETRTIVLVITPEEKASEAENSAYVQFEHGQTVRSKIARPGLHVRITAPPQAVVPEPVRFVVEVTNTGRSPAREVVLTEEFSPGLHYLNGKPDPATEKPLTWQLGTLQPGQKKTIEYQATSTEPGSFTNQVKVKAAGDVQEKASCTVKFGEPKLTLRKRGPQRRVVNRPATYSITVSNPGTMAATGVQVSDELPSPIQLVRASDQGRVDGGYVRWDLGTLSPGARRTLQLVVRSPRSGKFANVAEVIAEQRKLSARDFTETRFETASGPVVEIDKSLDPLEVGQKATYTIRLINLGTAAVLHPSLIVTIPDELKVLAVRGPTTAPEPKGQMVHFDPLPALDPNAQKEYVVEVEAVKPGDVRLQVQLTDGRTGLGPPTSWEEKTTILAGGKTASPATGTGFFMGGPKKP
jgi:uncharacterized repeat protein (TIGR01451 family)